MLVFSSSYLKSRMMSSTSSKNSYKNGSFSSPIRSMMTSSSGQSIPSNCSHFLFLTSSTRLKPWDSYCRSAASVGSCFIELLTHRPPQALLLTACPAANFANKYKYTLYILRREGKGFVFAIDFTLQPYIYSFQSTCLAFSDIIPRFVRKIKQMFLICFYFQAAFLQACQGRCIPNLKDWVLAPRCLIRGIGT